jgi:hypothetical protein
MARSPRKKTAPAQVEATAKLIASLQFLLLGQKDTGIADYQTHVNMFNGYAVTFDGVIAAGCQIGEPLNAVCETSRFLAAMKQCGETYSITQTEGGKLSVKSGSFKVLVPTIDAKIMPTIEPDMPIAVIDDRLKDAFEALNWMVAEQDEQIYKASFLLRAGSMIATNGRVAAEYWHGIDLPPDLVIPKPFVVAVLKSGKKLAKFGYCSRSITFWFEDESFIRTQLFEDQWPDIDKLLNVPSDPKPVPPGLFDAVRVVKPFSVDGMVYLNEGVVASHPFEGEGAVFEMKGLPNGPAYVIDNILGIEAACKTIDFGPTQQPFFGDNIRGIIIGDRPYKSKVKPEPIRSAMNEFSQPPTRVWSAADMDDDIPF